ncbi:hypothetical protein ACOMHN_014402 [Nucella lapillus]
MDEFEVFDDIENMDVDSIMDEFEVVDDIENMDVDSILDGFEVFDDIENMDVDSILSPELYSHQTSGTKRPHLDLGLDSVESTPSPKRQKNEGEGSDHNVFLSGLEDRAPDPLESYMDSLEQREAAAAPVALDQAGTSAASAEVQPGHQAGTSSGVRPETPAGDQADASSATSGVQPDSSACSSDQAGTSSGSEEVLPGTSGSVEALPGTSSDQAGISAASPRVLPGTSAEVQGESPEHLTLPDLDLELDVEADGSWESQRMKFLKISFAKLKKCRSTWIVRRPPLVTLRNNVLIKNSIRRAQGMAMDFWFED